MSYVILHVSCQTEIFITNHKYLASVNNKVFLEISSFWFQRNYFKHDLVSPKCFLDIILLFEKSNYIFTNHGFYHNYEKNIVTFNLKVCSMCLIDWILFQDPMDTHTRSLVITTLEDGFRSWKCEDKLISAVVSNEICIVCHV